MRILYSILKNFSCSYYKNSISSSSGWNSEVVAWCQREASRLNLKEKDLWGGLIFDEMTIQVNEIEIQASAVIDPQRKYYLISKNYCLNINSFDLAINLKRKIKQLKILMI